MQQGGLWWRVHCRVSQTFGERFKEHLKSLSPTYDHQSKTGHNTSVEDFIIVGSEGHNLAKAIKESVFIRVNNPTLNESIGKYSLPHIWHSYIQHSRTQNQEPEVTSNAEDYSSSICSRKYTGIEHYLADLMKPSCLEGKSLSQKK